MPTIAARADAWTKLAAADESMLGTRVYYEGVGLSQPTIDRLEREKQQSGAIASLNAMAETMAIEAAKAAALPPAGGEAE